MKRVVLALVALVAAALILLFVRNRVAQDRAAAASASAAWASLIGNDDFVTTENPPADAGEGEGEEGGNGD